jgi:hypothetical protein
MIRAPLIAAMVAVAESAGAQGLPILTSRLNDVAGGEADRRLHRQ